MKKLSNNFQTFVMGCLALFCCYGIGLAQQVRYDFVQGTDFSKYRTYKWVEVQGGTHPDQIISGQIRQAIDSQLAAKGLTKTNDENADLYVSYQIAVDQQKQWNAYGMGGGWGWGGGMATATSSIINIDTLVLDIYDRAAKKQIWQGRVGSVTKDITPGKNPEKTQEHLDKAVAKLLKNYPPPLKK